MLTSFCNLLGTNDCSAIPSFFPVLWPLLTSCGSLLLCIFSPMRPQDLPGYSHVLFLFTCRIYRKAIPCSDWALFCYANLPSPPALYAISVRQARALPIRGTFSPYSGFLQIPPHDGHPCLRLSPSLYRADSGLSPFRNVRRRAHSKNGRAMRVHQPVDKKGTFGSRKYPFMIINSFSSRKEGRSCPSKLPVF